MAKILPVYRLEVQHYVDVDPPPDSRPAWKKLLGISAPFPGGYYDVTAVDPIPGTFASLDLVYQAAEEWAQKFTGEIPDGSAVVIVEIESGDEIDHIYPSKGGRA